MTSRRRTKKNKENENISYIYNCTNPDYWFLVKRQI